VVRSEKRLKGKSVVAAGLRLDGGHHALGADSTISLINSKKVSVGVGGHDTDVLLVVGAKTSLTCLVEGLSIELDSGSVDKAWGLGTTEDARNKDILKVSTGLTLDLGDKVLAIELTISSRDSRHILIELGQDGQELVVGSSSASHCLVEALGNDIRTRGNKHLKELAVVAAGITMEVIAKAAGMTLLVDLHQSHTLCICAVAEDTDELRIVSASTNDCVAECISISLRSADKGVDGTNSDDSDRCCCNRDGCNRSSCNRGCSDGGCAISGLCTVCGLTGIGTIAGLCAIARLCTITGLGTITGLSAIGRLSGVSTVVGLGRIATRSRGISTVHAVLLGC